MANAVLIGADAGGCSCLDAYGQDLTGYRDVGVDETEGKFADVSVRRCDRCGRLWLCYFVEYEAFTASGRWAMT